MYTIPDIELITNGVNGYDAQAAQDSTDIQAVTLGIIHTGVVSGCLVSVTAGQTLIVAPGSIVIGGIEAVISATSKVTVPAASTHDRRDIVTVNSAGVVTLTTGTPCTVSNWSRTQAALPPVKPPIPAAQVLLAEVYVPGGSVSVASIALVDKRVQAFVTTTALSSSAANRLWAAAHMR